MRGATVFIGSQVTLTAHRAAGDRTLWAIRYSEQIDAQMLTDLQAHLGTVAQQILRAPGERKPKQPHLGQNTIEVLIEEQQCRTQQRPVQILHLRLGHVRDLEN